jgi:predicted amidohydrolase
MVKIAVVQFHIRQTIQDEDWDVKTNIMKAERFIAEAARSKADIIVFPE